MSGSFSINGQGILEQRFRISTAIENHNAAPAANPRPAILGRFFDGRLAQDRGAE
jgi:hypothetical protein